MYTIPVLTVHIYTIPVLTVQMYTILVLTVQMYTIPVLTVQMYTKPVLTAQMYTIQFKSVIKYLSEQLTRPFAVLVKFAYYGQISLTLQNCPYTTTATTTFRPNHFYRMDSTSSSTSTRPSQAALVKAEVEA